jgi:adenosine kinase
LHKLAKIVIITKGDRGSEIYWQNKRILVKPVMAKRALDPTGAGDAYRAGLIKGLVRGLDIKSCGQLASCVAVYAAENYGTQNHWFTLREIRERYGKSYGECLEI